MNNLSTFYMIRSFAFLVAVFMLPIGISWIRNRRRINETNRRADVATAAMAALEKNPGLDVEEMLNKIYPKHKPLKEKLLRNLLRGCIATMLGVVFIGFGIYLGVNDLSGTDDPMGFVIFGLIALVIGIAFLINYFVGKRLLAKEIEAEERRLTTKE